MNRWRQLNNLIVDLLRSWKLQADESIALAYYDASFTTQAIQAIRKKRHEKTTLTKAEERKIDKGIVGLSVKYHHDLAIAIMKSGILSNPLYCMKGVDLLFVLIKGTSSSFALQNSYACSITIDLLQILLIKYHAFEHRFLL